MYNVGGIEGSWLNFLGFSPEEAEGLSTGSSQLPLGARAALGRKAACGWSQRSWDSGAEGSPASTRLPGRASSKPWRFPQASAQERLSPGMRRKNLGQSPKGCVMHHDQETQLGQDGKAGVLLTHSIMWGKRVN